MYLSLSLNFINFYYKRKKEIKPYTHPFIWHTPRTQVVLCVYLVLSRCESQVTALVVGRFILSCVVLSHTVSCISVIYINSRSTAGFDAFVLCCDLLGCPQLVECWTTGLCSLGWMNQHQSGI